MAYVLPVGLPSQEFKEWRYQVLDAVASIAAEGDVTVRYESFIVDGVASHAVMYFDRKKDWNKHFRRMEAIHKKYRVVD